MAAAFYHWSSSSSSPPFPSHDVQDVIDSEPKVLHYSEHVPDLQQLHRPQIQHDLQQLHSPQLEHDMLQAHDLAVAAPPRSKPKRRSRKATTHKGPPQRGLGVAQLERLRLQDRWKKMTEIDPDVSLPPCCCDGARGVAELHPASGAEETVRGYRQDVQRHFPIYETRLQAPAPPAQMGYGVPWGESTFMQRNRARIPSLWGSGSTPLPSRASPVLPRDPDLLFRHRFGEERHHQVGFLSSELSSNQRLAGQCLSECCDICVKSERVLENESHFARDESAKMVWDIDHEEKKGRAREVKEYEFFPCTSTASGLLKREEEAQKESSFGRWIPSASATSSFVDLSLRLSC